MDIVRDSPDEKHCIDYMESMCWPEGVRCVTGVRIMIPPLFFRISGVACILGGVLIPIFFIIHPGGQEPATSAVVLATHYAAIHTLAVIGYIAVSFGFVGAFIYQADLMNVLATAGMLLGFAGSTMLVGTFMHDGYDNPYMATIVSGVDLNGHEGGLERSLDMGIAIGVAGVLFIIGFVVFGIATIRAAVFPRWCGALLIVGTIITDLPPPPDTRLLHVLTGHPAMLPWALLDFGATTLGIGLIGLGSTMLCNPQRIATAHQT